jgi:A/G-specific adenine glycosylase
VNGFAGAQVDERGRPPSPTRIRGGVRSLRESLLAWYDAQRRDWPWRRNRDPYRVWVAEVMLQQTRLAVVAPAYRRFLRKFPTVRRLARAEEDAVLAARSRLGDYSRARA